MGLPPSAKENILTFFHRGSSKTTHLHILVQITNRNKKKQKLARIIRIVNPSITNSEIELVYSSVQEVNSENIEFLAKLLSTPPKYDVVTTLPQKSPNDIFFCSPYITESLNNVQPTEETAHGG